MFVYLKAKCVTLSANNLNGKFMNTSGYFCEYYSLLRVLNLLTVLAFFAGVERLQAQMESRRLWRRGHTARSLGAHMAARYCAV